MILRNKPVEQNYSLYTAGDFTVWKELFSRQYPFVKKAASRLYLEALQKIGFTADAIPDFRDVNKRLQQYTGWQLTVVPELVPQKEFFELLANKTFPATCWLRTPGELDYIEEPDMFHDVFGHVPLLINKTYTDFFQSFGKLATKWIDVPEAIVMLGRVYWYTVEFGLLDEEDTHKIFGAGIISSIGETAHVAGDESLKVPFGIQQMMMTDYRIDTLQPKYFVMDSFEQLCSAIPDIDKRLTKLLSQQPTI